MNRLQIIAASLMLVGGFLLKQPSVLPTPASGLLAETYRADKASRIETLRYLGSMVTASVEERSKTWEKMDREAFTKNFDKLGDVVSQAILEHKELELAKQWESE